MHLRLLCEALCLPFPQAEDVPLTGVSTLEDAGPRHLAALFDRRYVDSARRTRAGAVIVRSGLADCLPPHTVPLIAPDASAVWSRAIRLLHPSPTFRRPSMGRHPSAAVDADAVVNPSARIGALCIIEAGAHISADAILHGGVFVGAGAYIGDHVELLPRTVIMDGVRVERGARIGPGAVIGGPGFGLDADGPIPHIGGVVVGAHATIGANACVDRGQVGETIIGEGAHLDNLVQVGHGVQIGSGVVICGQAGIAGSARIEPGVVIGGQAGVADHVHIHAGVRVAAQSGVTRDLVKGGDYSGHPAEPNRQRLRRVARLKRLVDP